MPIYEYRRPDGTTFEVLQSFSDEPLKRDPDTGVEVTRVLHAPAVHFKGSGFYNTDYGTRSRQRETQAAAESSKEGSSKESSSKSESSSTTEGKTKPESKSSSPSEGSSSKESSSKSKAPASSK